MYGMEPEPEAIDGAIDAESVPPEITVQSRGIDTNLDSGKEYIVYTFGLYIGNERVHTIEGRYSELRSKHDGLSKAIASKAVFPSKQAGLFSAKNMTSDSQVRNEAQQCR